MSDDISIRRAETPAEYRACQDAQRKAWGLDDEAYVVPVATMVGAQLHGGLVLGAFLASGEAVGFSFAFLGRIEGRLGLYSQLTGVVPEMQGKGLGKRLKLAQRDFARAEGLEVIAWAFDPFQTGNAHFNLEVLGAVGVRYVDDMYGSRTDALNRGAATDRLIVVWEIDSQVSAGREPPDIDALPRLIARDAGPAGIASRSPVSLDQLQASAILEIPGDIRAMREKSPQVAESWRRALRSAFHDAFAAGYRASRFVKAPLEGFYVLEAPRPPSRSGD